MTQRRFVAPSRLLTISAVLSVALASTATLRLLFESGTPAFYHDWLWPVDRGECLHYALIGFTAWNSSGGGSAQLFPEPWLPYGLTYPLCAVTGPQWALFIALFSCITIAGIGAAAAARAFAQSDLAVLSCVAVYIGNPVILNELHAGHLLFIFSYMLLPWIVVLSRGRNIPERALLLGATIGIAGAQQQFLVLGSIVALVFLRSSTYKKTALTTLVVAALVSGPQWIQLFVSGQSGLGVYAPLHHWEASQSAPPVMFVRMLGYIGGYDARLPAIVQTSLFAYPLLALAGLSFLRGRLFIVCCALVVLAAIALNGTNSPTGSAVDWIFAHVTQMALFRELYNFAALLAIVYALCIAVLIDRVRFAPAALAIFAVCLAIASACDFYALRGVTTAHPPLTAAFADVPSYRSAISPAFFPQRVVSPGSGLNPLILGLGGHVLANVPEPLSYPASYLSALTDAGQFGRAAIVARALGVACIIPLAGVNEDIAPSLEPRLRTLPFQNVERLTHPLCSHGGERVQVARPIAATPGFDLAANEGEVAVEIPGSGLQPPVNLMSYDDSPDPRVSWTPLAWYPGLSPWLYREPNDYFTMRPDVELPTSGGNVLLAAGGGQIHSDTCSDFVRIDAHWVTARCAPHAKVRAIPPIVFAGTVLRDTTVIPRSVLASKVSIEYETSWLLIMRATVNEGNVLFLKDGYDRLWKCLGPRAVHVLADRYANGWIFARSFSGTVVLFYQAALIRYAAIAISIILLCFVAVRSYQKVVAA